MKNNVTLKKKIVRNCYLYMHCIFMLFIISLPHIVQGLWNISIYLLASSDTYSSCYIYSVYCFLTKQSFIIGSVTSLRTLMSVCSFVDRSVVILGEITLPSHLSEHLKNKDKATQRWKKYHHDKLLVKGF